jgi:hypothetical protein
MSCQTIFLIYYAKNAYRNSSSFSFVFMEMEQLHVIIDRESAEEKFLELCNNVQSSEILPRKSYGLHHLRRIYENNDIVGLFTYSQRKQISVIRDVQAIGEKNMKVYVVQKFRDMDPLNLKLFFTFPSALNYVRKEFRQCLAYHYRSDNFELPDLLLGKRKRESPLSEHDSVTNSKNLELLNDLLSLEGTQKHILQHNNVTDINLCGSVNDLQSRIFECTIDIPDHPAFWSKEKFNEEFKKLKYFCDKIALVYKHSCELTLDYGLIFKEKFMISFKPSLKQKDAMLQDFEEDIALKCTLESFNECTGRDDDDRPNVLDFEFSDLSCNDCLFWNNQSEIDGKTLLEYFESLKEKYAIVNKEYAMLMLLGKMKNSPNDCPFAKLPFEIIREIFKFLKFEF